MRINVNLMRSIFKIIFLSSFCLLVLTFALLGIYAFKTDQRIIYLNDESFLIIVSFISFISIISNVSFGIIILTSKNKSFKVLLLYINCWYIIYWTFIFTVTITMYLHYDFNVCWVITIFSLNIIITVVFGMWIIIYKTRNNEISGYDRIQLLSKECEKYDIYDIYDNISDDLSNISNNPQYSSNDSNLLPDNLSYSSYDSSNE